MKYKTEVERLEARKRWREKYRQQIKIHKRAYYFKNKDEWRQKKRARVLQLKTEIIQHYSKNTMICANCGLADLKNLTVDHINGGGENHRRRSGLSGGHSFYVWLKRLNFPPGFQILCFACNMAKGGRYI